MRFFNRSGSLGSLVFRVAILGGLGGYFAWMVLGEFLRSGRVPGVEAFFAVVCGVALVIAVKARRGGAGEGGGD